MSRHLNRRPGARRLAVAFLGVAASAITLLATTSTPALAASNHGLIDRHVPMVHAGGVPSSKRAEALGSHGPRFASKGPSARVAGGEPADIRDFPGIVGIRNYYSVYDAASDMEIPEVDTCTGTLISPTKVITAAHCTIDFPFGDIQVIAGRNNLDDQTSGTVYAVSNTWTHQGYNIGAQSDDPTVPPMDDVSILTLKTPADPVYVPYSLTAQGDQTPYAEGTQAEIVGYGRTFTNGTSGILYKASVPMQSDADCTSAAAGMSTTYDHNRMICAGELPSTPGTASGVGTCFGDSGGPLLVDGVETAITDWGAATCGTTFSFFERMSYYHSAVDVDVNRTNMPVNLDFSGDEHSDLLYRSIDGYLAEITGAGLMFSTAEYGSFGGMADWNWISGSGWNAYSKIFRVTNWNGDHTESIFAEKPDGSLYQYKTDGAGHFKGKPSLIGSGWSMFKDIMVTNDWLGDGRSNLMGRKTNGDLVLYTSNGSGGWTNPHGTVIGTGWGSFNTIITPGNWRGQGQALIGRTSTGDLKLYESNGHGGWLNAKGTVIGTGWNGLPTFISPGDWNGDNLIDLIGIAKNGDMTLYRTDGSGHWLNGKGDKMMGGAWDNGFFDGIKLFF